MQALLPLIVTFGLMWALLIRPQQRRVRQHQELVATLGPGDEVITTGGIVGTIAAVVDDIVTLEVAPALSIRVLRSAIQTRIAGEGEEEGVVDDEFDDDDLFDEAQFDAEPVAEPPASPAPGATQVPGAPADDAPSIPPPTPPPPTPPPPNIPPTSTPPTTEEKA
ncbi:MAG: preprotein translocase subunit YajC [Actinomycetota bacterium]|jgi:preprotein translocase subunit YajC|nr:preprotein translocase subunit YajC [Actinomycetota bacterium]